MQNINEVSSQDIEADKRILKLNEHSYDFRIADDKKYIPDILKLAEASHLESRFAYIPFCPDKTKAIALSAFKNTKRHAVMMAYKNEAPVGFVYCSVGEYHIGKDVLLTTIHNLNVLHSIRSNLSGGKVALGLLKGVTTWAKARNSHEILFHVTSDVGLAGAHKLAKKLGYKFVGGSYVKTML